MIHLWALIKIHHFSGYECRFCSYFSWLRIIIFLLCYFLLVLPAFPDLWFQTYVRLVLILRYLAYRQQVYVPQLLIERSVWFWMPWRLLITPLRPVYRWLSRHKTFLRLYLNTLVVFIRFDADFRRFFLLLGRRMRGQLALLYDAVWIKDKVVLI